MKKYFILLFVMGVNVVCLQQLFASDVSLKSQRLDQLYATGQYGKALELAKELRLQTDDSNLLYDMGSIYAKSGKLGLSIAMYNRYLTEHPRDQDAVYNLNYIRAQRKDLIEKEDNIIKTLLKPHYLLSRQESRVVALFFWLVMLVVLSISRLPKSFVFATIVLWMSTSCSWLFKEFKSIKQDRGVVIVSQVDVRSGSGDNYTDLFALHDGAEVHIGRRKGDWVQISLGTKLGWVKANCLAMYSSQGI